MQKNYFSFQGTVATFYNWDAQKQNCLCQISCVFCIPKIIQI